MTSQEFNIKFDAMMATATDSSHLVALTQGLSNETARLKAAKSPAEIAHRTVWVAQLQSQVDSEMIRLGMTPTVTCGLSEDDLLAELMA